MCPTVLLVCGTEPCALLLNVTGVPRHTPRGPVSPPRSCSPPQDGTKSRHNRDITFIHGPRHCSPKCARNFLGQQRQAHLPPTEPHEPRCSDFAGYPSFIRPYARSEGETQYLGFPRTYLVDHGATPRPIDTAILDCAVHMTVDAFALGRH